MNVKCFLLSESGRVQRSLRRYVSGSTCSGAFGYHNVSVNIDQAEQALNEQGYVEQGPEVPRADPRWPTHCACGYAFRDADPWQTNSDPIYVRADTGEAVGILRDVPPGAMWDAWWMRARREPFHADGSDMWVGPDGRCLTVKLPNGIDWHIDGPATNAPSAVHGWTRTGTPPLLTVTPSILARDYHGFLTNGELIPC